MYFIKYMPWKLKCILFENFLRRNKVQFSPSPSCAGDFPIIHNRGTIKLGEKSLFWGHFERSRIFVSSGAILEIGDSAFLNDGVFVHVSNSIKIGDHVKIGLDVQMFDSDFHDLTPARPLATKPITIGRNVWIGNRATVLPGSSIGDHSIIGAGAVVRGSIPARSIAIGNPAKVIKTFEAPDDWVRK